jgi:hypothetical protein
MFQSVTNLSTMEAYFYMYWDTENSFSNLDEKEGVTRVDVYKRKTYDPRPVTLIVINNCSVT